MSAPKEKRRWPRARWLGNRGATAASRGCPSPNRPSIENQTGPLCPQHAHPVPIGRGRDAAVGDDPPPSIDGMAMGLALARLRGGGSSGERHRRHRFGSNVGGSGLVAGGSPRPPVSLGHGIRREGPGGLRGWRWDHDGASEVPSAYDGGLRRPRRLGELACRTTETVSRDGSHAVQLALGVGARSVDRDVVSASPTFILASFRSTLWRRYSPRLRIAFYAAAIGNGTDVRRSSPKALNDHLRSRRFVSPRLRDCRRRTTAPTRELVAVNSRGQRPQRQSIGTLTTESGARLSSPRRRPEL